MSKPSSHNSVRFGPPAYVGDIESSELDDLSGIEPSTYRNDLLWGESNRGDATLFAISNSGEHIASIEVNGTHNTDWEDLTSFQRDDQPYLLIADTGGNLTKNAREYYDIVCIQEPAPNSDGRFPKEIEAEWTIRFTYEGIDEKKRPDCEAIAVDGDRILLLLKEERNSGSRLFQLPLPSSSVKGEVATRVGKITGIVDAAKRLRHSKTRPTGMDIRHDGNLAIVLTSVHAYAFGRNESESWEEAFSKEPDTIRLPSMLQPECISFSSNGNSFFVSSERKNKKGRNAPLFEIPLFTD